MQITIAETCIMASSTKLLPLIFYVLKIYTYLEYFLMITKSIFLETQKLGYVLRNNGRTVPTQSKFRDDFSIFWLLQQHIAENV